MDEALAKVPEEVVVAGFRLRRDEPTARLGKLLFHLQSGETAQDEVDIGGRKCLNAEAAVVESDAHRADGHFRFLVKRQRWRRVERDQVPDQLRATVRQTLASNK